ncbi:MAG: sulfur oxidation c-type cytochrome SoxA [Hyphomicrobiales bacterium]
MHFHVRNLCWAVSAVLAAAALPAHAPAARADEAAEIERGIAKYREMLKADPFANPGLLDADRGEVLWKTPAGEAKVTLEKCDLGKGPGVVEGAFAELPRYFADVDRVMDAESRVLWCMEKLQGLDMADFRKKPHPGGGSPVKDLGAMVTWIANQSAGKVFAAPKDHAKEKQAIALGEAIFFRRQGPHDFSCASCHTETGKRIRLQPLPALAEPAEAMKVVGEWPAYRVSSTHVMTMQHRLYDCFWQMRMPQLEFGSEVAVALVAYLVDNAAGGEISAPAIKR